MDVSGYIMYSGLISPLSSYIFSYGAYMCGAHIFLLAALAYSLFSGASPIYLNVGEYKRDTCFKELKTHVSKTSSIEWCYIAQFIIMLCQGSRRVPYTLIMLFKKTPSTSTY